MAYNSAYTGPQIDSAVAAAQKALTIDGGTINGTLTIYNEASPYNSFLALIVKDTSSSAGTGTATVRASQGFGPDTDSGPSYYIGGAYFDFASPICVNGASNGCCLKLNGGTINNVGDPQYGIDAANKRYVDNAIATAISGALEASY